MRPYLVLLVFLTFQSSFSVMAQVPELSALESQYLSDVRQVTSLELFQKAGEGYFSPDEKQIIYQAVPHDYIFYQIYTQPLNGNAPRLISTGRGRTTCSFFHPRQPKLLFSSSHLDPHLGETEANEKKTLAELQQSGRRRRYVWDFDPYMDIFEADLQGAIIRRLTNEMGYDAEGAWSPDGKLIVFCSDRDGDPDLYIMDADGQNVRQLTDAQGYDGGPFVSPEGKWVVFRSDRKQEHLLQVYVIGIDGKNETALTDNNGVNWAPYWHPTQPYIIWTGADHSVLAQGKPPNYDLWLMKYHVTERNFQADAPVRVTDNPAADVLPVFSPDGTKLMWTSNRTNNRTSQLWIASFTLP